ncbi:MAG: arylsulfatase [Verrucomicrobiota bacterium]
MKRLFLSLLIAGMSIAALDGAERPNVILIMVDDMGFSDLGYHGGEIETPNIDGLAYGGVRFSHFYNSGRCCPTRATLLTGAHPHETGIGHMTQPPGNERGEGRPPAYQGYLNRECVTIAEVLGEAGYATFLAGKWHLGYNARDRWPLQRGFEKFYGCLSGATRFFYPEAPRDVSLGNDALVNPESTTDRPYYTTDAFTDYGIRFMKDELEGEGRPFFLYLAYTAPHWPLQAHEEDIDKYRDRYHEGWDVLREERYQRQIELGLIDASWALSPRDEDVPAWEDVDEEEREEMALKMAVYAAMVDCVDQNVGRVISFLKDEGIYEDTLILFLTDNGACAEGGTMGRGEFVNVERRNQQSANSYGAAWANASSTPFRLYKHFAHEGGAATPFFMHWPAAIEARYDWYAEPAQLIDVVPTIIDVAGAIYPETYGGNAIVSLDGMTLRPAFEGESLGRVEPIFIEHEDNAFVLDGNWKLVGRGVSPAKGVDQKKWELYDLAADRTELNDLAARKPEKLEKLAQKWDEWAGRVGVYPKELRGGNKGKKQEK